MLIILLLSWASFSTFIHSINENIKSVIIRSKNELIVKSRKINSEAIVVIEIDEKTLDRFGFPFSRKEYAIIIDNLNKANAEII
jgi:CHASE2 domain-containing sensor protein